MTKPRVIVDTSVWIEYFRHSDSEAKRVVDFLIEGNRVFLVGIILAELLQWIRNEEEFELLQFVLSALPSGETSFSTWVKAGYISRLLRRKGVSIPLSDSLIAAVAQEKDCQVYTLDPNFKQIENLELYQPELSPE